MKQTKQTLNLLITAIIVITLTACSGGFGGGIKQLQTDVNGPFNEYFQIIDNASKIERVQDGDWVQYEFNTLIKVKKTFPCVDYFDTKNSIFDNEKVGISLKFYGEDKKPLPINGKQEIAFFTHANTTVGKNFCEVIGQAKDSEVWFSFKTRNLKKESTIFDAYPSENIKYFTVETGQK